VRRIKKLEKRIQDLETNLGLTVGSDTDRYKWHSKVWLNKNMLYPSYKVSLVNIVRLLYSEVFKNK